MGGMSNPRMSGPDQRANEARSLPQARTAPADPEQADPEQADPAPADSLYARAGGDAFFVGLVDAFYGRVAQDPVLRPLYPDADLQAANERLRMFLIQYWGGPTTYSQRRGHPRLRMRHAPFPVGDTQISAWLQNMRGALDQVDAAPEIDAELWAYFQHAAPSLRNQPS